MISGEFLQPVGYAMHIWRHQTNRDHDEQLLSEPHLIHHAEEAPVANNTKLFAVSMWLRGDSCCRYPSLPVNKPSLARLLGQFGNRPREFAPDEIHRPASRL